MAAYTKVIETVSQMNETFHTPINELGNTAALTEESSVSLECIAQSVWEVAILLDKISRNMTKFKI